MSYINTYKKRIMLNGSTELETITNDSKHFINSEFKNDPSYKLAILQKCNFEKCEIDIRVVNIDNSTSKKKMYLRPDFRMDKGDYVTYDSRIFMVEEFEENLLSPCAKVTTCNQTLNCKGQSKPIPCVVDNTVHGTGVKDNGYFVEYDSRLKILIQKNKETDRYYIGMRFIFNNRFCYKITKIDNITSNEIYMIELVLSSLSPLDDLENNIAYNEKLEDNKPPENYEIIGVDKIKVGQTETYKIKPQRLDIVYEIDDKNYAIIVEQQNGECKVKALKQNGIVTLSAKCDTEILDEFNIITM